MPSPLKHLLFCLPKNFVLNPILRLALRLNKVVGDLVRIVFLSILKIEYLNKIDLRRGKCKNECGAIDKR
jgi:hypothetical protein